MFPSILLALREGLEATLIIGMVLGILTRMKQERLKPVVWWGVGTASLVSIAAAIILEGIGAEFEGRGEQIFEGTAMLLATGLLTWMIFWMRGRARSMKSEVEANVHQALLQTGKGALFGLAFLAVVREGLELALYLVAARMTSTALQTAIGATLGLIAAGVLGWMLFSTTRRLNVSAFFRFTNILLVVFAAGMVAHTIHEYTEAGILPALINPLWNLSAILSDESSLGLLLSTLLGYHSSPSLFQLVGYLGYLILITLGLRGERLPVPIRNRSVRI